jgi:hypothetical protein
LTVTLPKRVLKLWREISADTYKVSLDLLLTTRMDSAAATDVLSQSVDRVLRDFEAAHAEVPPDEEMPFAGQWDVVRVPEGALLLGGYKSDAFEEVLQAIVEDLSREGVRGKLDLYARPEVPWDPRGIGTIEARIRVLGRRVMDHRERWAADRYALERVIEAAANWCLEARPDRAVTLRHAWLPTLVLRRCDSPMERLREVLSDDNEVRLASIGDERFRRMTVVPRDGSVTVVEGGPVLHRSGWRPSVEAVTGLVRHVSSDAVYASVGRTRPWAEEERRLRMAWGEEAAHEEHLAPDVFPIQLLGPGYAGRVPAGKDWRATDLGEGRVLLEHVDQAAWLDEVTLEEGLLGDTIPRADLVERARASFGDVLFTDITKEERDGQHAWRMAHPEAHLPEGIVAKVHALPETPYIHHWDVALVLRDGSVVEDVEIGAGGTTVRRIGGEREFSLDPDEVVDVLDRSTR